MTEKLAIDGGKPVRAKRLPFEFPGGNWYGKEEAAAATRVILAKSPFRYYGPDSQNEVDKFEVEFARFIGAKYALAVNSGTQSLAVAMSALGVGPGCEVIVPGYMWLAIVASVLRLGAIPVLAEVDDSFTLDPAKLEKKINKRTKLVVVVHMSGAPANMPAILKVARKRKVAVLEDCAQANGGSINGRKVGSFGDMAIFSLQLNKNLTTGEGGMITTSSQHLLRRAFSIHDLGYPRINGRLELKNGPYALWGFGGRMTEIAGAIGRVQLKKLPKVIAAMRASKAAIKKGLAGVKGITWRRLNDDKGDTACFLIWSVPTAAQAKRMAAALDKENIASGLSATMTVADFGMHVYYNIHSLVEKHSNSADGFPWTLEANRKSNYNYNKGALPQTDKLLERSIIMPIPSVMSKQDIADVIAGIKKVAAVVLK